MDDSKSTDGLVTATDVRHVKAEVDQGNFQQLVFDLVANEPDLAIDVSEKFDLVLTILQGVGMSIRQRAVLEKQLALLTWMPLLLLSRAHRRAWDDFLPGAADAGEKGGAE